MGRSNYEPLLNIYYYRGRWGVRPSFLEHGRCAVPLTILSSSPVSAQAAQQSKFTDSGQQRRVKEKLF